MSSSSPHQLLRTWKTNLKALQHMDGGLTQQQFIKS